MIFFLFGEDIFRSKEKMKELKKAFSEKNPSSEISIFDFSEKNIDIITLLESFSSSGLFSTKKMIIIESLLKELPAENQKLILEKIKRDKDLKESEKTMVIFRENGQPKKSLAFFKYLNLNSKKQEFNLLDFRNLEKWASDYIKTNYPDISFSPKSLPILVSYVGNDLFLLSNELEKLANFRTKGEISENDIALLVKSHTESTVFQTTEALLSGNRRAALRLFHEQIEKGEDLFYILSMYVYQIRTLLKIASSLESGSFNPASIAKETGIHPYVVQKSILQARLSGTVKLKNIYRHLEKIDRNAKIGKLDIKLSLDKLIVQI